MLEGAPLKYGHKEGEIFVFYVPLRQILDAFYLKISKIIKTCSLMQWIFFLEVFFKVEQFWFFSTFWELKRNYFYPNYSNNEKILRYFNAPISWEIPNLLSCQCNITLKTSTVFNESNASDGFSKGQISSKISYVTKHSESRYMSDWNRCNYTCNEVDQCVKVISIFYVHYKIFVKIDNISQL